MFQHAVPVLGDLLATAQRGQRAAERTRPWPQALPKLRRQQRGHDGRPSAAAALFPIERIVGRV